MLPAESTAKPVTEPVGINSALVAGPPSPPAPGVPLPATVVIMPDGLTFLTLPVPVSKMYRLPCLSKVTPLALVSQVLVA
jgi:hypothetical protein